MAKNKDRTDEIEFDDDDLDLDWDNDDDDDAELNDDGDDEEFDTDRLTAAERKRYEKMRSSIEDSLVEAISKGDTNSGVYKGLQRVLASRDRELAAARTALAAISEETRVNSEKVDEVDFLKDIILNILDDDSKKVFEDKYKQHQSNRKAQRNEALLQSLVNQGQQFNQGFSQNNSVPDEIVQYRKEATKTLKNFAKKMGVDPDDKELDYGNEEDVLLDRMTKLQASIERINDDEDRDIQRIRRKGARPNTRSPRDVGNRSDDDDDDYESIATNILNRGANQMVRRMRELSSDTPKRKARR